MSKRTSHFIVLFILLILCFNSNRIFAQHRTEGFKRGSEKLNWGFSERIRWVRFDNIIDLNKKEDDKNNFFRFRTSLWGDSELWRGCKLYLKFTNEFRKYHSPEVEFTWDEIFIDNLYLEWKNLLGSLWSAKIGRQDLFYGDGLVIMDGGPLDGSRSIYFNSAKLSWGDSILGLDFIGIQNTQKDKYLPVINNKNKKLVEQEEKCWGVIYRRGYSREQTFEAYYLWKREKTEFNSYTHTYGAKTRGLMARDLTYTGEFAYQTGKLKDRERRAYGGEFNFTKVFRTKYSPLIKSGYIHLTGDKEGTDRFEGWNPLFSRWPKWSELYIYTLIEEDKTAYWTNLKAYWFGLSLILTKNSILDFKYYNLSTDEKASPEKIGFISTGKKRGDLYQLKLNIIINQKISGHLLWERFKPGSYYFDGAEEADFIRFEFFYNYSSK